jgi:hypothetical protein
MKWISVKDRLPEEGKSVILYDRIVGVCCGYLERTSDGRILFEPDTTGMSGDMDFYGIIDNVTHWMDKPEEPRKSVVTGVRIKYQYEYDYKYKFMCVYSDNNRPVNDPERPGDVIVYYSNDFSAIGEDERSINNLIKIAKDLMENINK